MCSKSNLERAHRQNPILGSAANTKDISMLKSFKPHAKPPVEINYPFESDPVVVYQSKKRKTLDEQEGTYNN
jgi:hypothetical protein